MVPFIFLGLNPILVTLCCCCHVWLGLVGLFPVYISMLKYVEVFFFCEVWVLEMHKVIRATAPLWSLSEEFISLASSLNIWQGFINAAVWDKAFVVLFFSNLNSLVYTKMFKLPVFFKCLGGGVTSLKKFVQF